MHGPLAPQISATDFQRKVAAGQGQLAQSAVTKLKLSEWARLLLMDDVQKFPDRDNRAAVSLLMAGHVDATKSKVCRP